MAQGPAEALGAGPPVSGVTPPHTRGRVHVHCKGGRAVPVAPSSPDPTEENRRTPQTSRVLLQPPRLLETKDATGSAIARAGSAGVNLGTSALPCELEEGLSPPRPVSLSGRRKRGLRPCASAATWRPRRCRPGTHHRAVWPKALQLAGVSTMARARVSKWPWRDCSFSVNRPQGLWASRWGRVGTIRAVGQDLGHGVWCPFCTGGPLDPWC